MFKVDPLDLHRVLHNAALFAGTDRTLPTLCTVRVIWAADRLLVDATDRYVIGHDHCAITDNRADGSTLVDTQDVKDLLPRLKRATGTALVTIPERDKLVIDLMYSTIMIQGRIEQDYPAVEKFLSADYPDETADEPTVVTVALAPKHMARFAKVLPNPAENNPPMRLTFTDRIKPVRVLIGETFKAVIQPVNMHQ
ncbi:MAG: hypothetical protein ACRD0W_07515 [Acidimicrobiales bacterium]